MLNIYIPQYIIDVYYGIYLQCYLEYKSTNLEVIFFRSKFLTLSPKPLRFEAVKKSIAGKIFCKSDPGKLTSLGLYTPVAISTASCFYFKSFNVKFFPISIFC